MAIFLSNFLQSLFRPLRARAYSVIVPNDRPKSKHGYHYGHGIFSFFGIICLCFCVVYVII